MLEVKMSLIGKIASWWAVDDTMSLPPSIDLIAMVSHGATNHGVTTGAKTVTKMGCTIAENYPAALIFFGAFTESPIPEIEMDYKLARIPHAHYVGTVISTIEECAKIQSSLPEGFTPKTIVVVTDEAHSRRARIVWKTFFPNSKIYIVSMALEAGLDDDSPSWAYHAGWSALLFQAAPTPYFWYLGLRGLEYMNTKATSLHQPVAK